MYSLTISFLKHSCRIFDKGLKKSFLIVLSFNFIKNNQTFFYKEHQRLKRDLVKKYKKKTIDFSINF